jgi:poly(A) polymerase
VSLETLRAAAASLAPWGRRFAEAGGWRLYVVGGAVRSLLRGKLLGPDDEVDMTTDAPPPAVREILTGWADTTWTQGERFGTIGCRRDGRTVEITTHRAEVYAAGSRRPEVSYGDDVLADLARRDFTIGAMAFEVPPAAGAGVELIDPFGGWEDLQQGRLRTPRSPEVSFADDPLRMLRAGRFVATLDLVAEPALEVAMEALRGRLEIVSVERCARELELMLLAAAPSAGAELLARTGVLAEIVPELRTADSGPPPGAALVDAMSPEVPERLAALLWSVVDVEAVARRLRFPAATARRAGAIAAAARAVTGGAGAATGDEMVRRWAAAAGTAAPAATRLATAASPTPAVSAFAARWARLDAGGDLAAPSPLSGAEVMAHLGIEEGPAVGAALRYLEDLRVVGGPLRPDEARRRLSDWWEAHVRRPPGG